MANRNKAKGTRAETKLVKYLLENGCVARRQALAGSDDQGDLEVYAPDSTEKIIVEVKAGKQTAAPRRSQIEDWCRQAEVEAVNAGGAPVLVVMRYQRALEDADVYIPSAHCRMHMYLDEWMEHLKENGR